jgi:tetraacyldisaccharide 4'-kinase
MGDAVYGWLHRAWYERAPGFQLLTPLSLLYGLVTALRRGLYRFGVFQTQRVPVPVIVVGNIVAGGVGKTPVTLFLVEALKRRGYTPGIVSRGHGRDDVAAMVEVEANSDPTQVGDEPLLLARRSGCPVFVARDRVAAARALVAKGVDVVVADDGLQHYRLGRDYELCIVDGERGLGNGWLIPAGPLRERAGRLASVDAVLVNGEARHSSLHKIDAPSFHYRAMKARRLDGSEERSLAAFSDQPLQAVAGIGNPTRFFRMLESFGLAVTAQPLRDHASFDPTSLRGDGPVLMTEKDAVKLSPLRDERLWFVPVDLELDPDAATGLLDSIDEVCRRKLELKHE